MIEWKDINDHPINMNIPHLLVCSDSLYLRGGDLQPFFIQISGMMRKIGEVEFTHWMPLPQPPEHIPDADKKVDK